MARSDWWPYRHCYAAVKGAWNEIELILARRCPSVYSQLVSSKGATEEDIASCVKKLKVDLPNDYRCSLRIHDQLLSLGDLDYPACSRTRYVLLGLKDLFTVDFEIKLNVYRKQVMVRKESMLVLAKYALCNMELSALEPFSELLVVLSSASEEDTGCVVTVYTRSQGRDQTLLVSNETFTFAEWLQQEADRCSRYFVTPIDCDLTRFTLQPSSMLVNGYFTVCVYGVFDLSFGYLEYGSAILFSGRYFQRTVISLSPEAPESCLLHCHSVHWDLEFHTFDGNIVIEEVEQEWNFESPVILHPGKSYEHTTSSSVREYSSLMKHGVMEAHYLSSPDSPFKIPIPPYCMESRHFSPLTVQYLTPTAPTGKWNAWI
jgi:hypothetical protein